MPLSPWTWLTKEDNRGALILLGGAVAALASACWAVYTYEPPAKSQPTQPAATTGPVPPQPTQSAVADNGGIAINADGNANVSVHQSKP